MRIFEFLKRQVVIAHVYGIPVRADYRWFFVLALLSWVTAANINWQINSPAAAGLFGVITTLVFFGSIFIHELAHAFIARMEGLRVVEIVLHPFGGTTRFRNEPETPEAEFRIAIAGPAASFVFSLVAFAGMMLTAVLESNFGTAFFFFVGAGNLLLAVFNLFPGYPLDGGRVLRAIIWKRSGSMRDATRIAGFCGQLMSFVLIAFGLYMALAPTFRAYFMGFWSILVGVFLLGAATSVVRSVREPATVADAMSAPFALEPDLPIRRFVDEILPLHRYASFPVATNKRLLGILTLEDLKKRPREEWRDRCVRDAMRPVNPSMFIKASATLGEANELIQGNRVGAVAVIEESGELVGFLRPNPIRREKK